ncbi:hypothetical protein AVEN_231774-1 [Araneus ventricosus]|uniref:Uncharacterized protein n=1 Tax=Araneus ventricosus TaxID=182803 RepID=A0A4Y2SNX0_ARAVE|nr:hypothetical protein AVEN_231774-1 [Araneus ventricosus]
MVVNILQARATHRFQLPGLNPDRNVSGTRTGSNLPGGPHKSPPNKSLRDRYTNCYAQAIHLVESYRKRENLQRARLPQSGNTIENRGRGRPNRSAETETE